MQCGGGGTATLVVGGYRRRPELGLSGARRSAGHRRWLGAAVGLTVGGGRGAARATGGAGEGRAAGAAKET
jgi:hypothetical protein